MLLHQMQSPSADLLAVLVKGMAYSQFRSKLSYLRVATFILPNSPTRFVLDSLILDPSLIYVQASADLLQKQKAITIITGSADGPHASLPSEFSFVRFFDDANPRDPAATHEKLVWQLAGVLFDEIAVPEELQQVPGISDRLRKDNLSAFWQKLVDDACSKHIAMGRTSEEKAIAALSGHRISDACAHLLESRDFHLATLVALIGTKDSMKKDMREQLNEWQNSQMLSEFSQTIRTIYELLAGNVCVCDGSKGQLEDRVESFVISKRFGLDWRQAFGLRLWYGIMSTDAIEQAVQDFAEDLAQDKETSKPRAWYVEQKVSTLWDDKQLKRREDLLWGLLRLYTFADADIEDVLRPENSQLSPLDIRLSWQLGQALTANGAVRYTEDDEDKADRTTLAFAAQLINEGSCAEAFASCTCAAMGGAWGARKAATSAGLGRACTPCGPPL